MQVDQLGVRYSVAHVKLKVRLPNLRVDNDGI